MAKTNKKKTEGKNKSNMIAPLGLKRKKASDEKRRTSKK